MNDHIDFPERGISLPKTTICHYCGGLMDFVTKPDGLWLGYICYGIEGKEKGCGHKEELLANNAFKETKPTDEKYL